MAKKLTPLEIGEEMTAKAYDAFLKAGGVKYLQRLSVTDPQLFAKEVIAKLLALQPKEPLINIDQRQNEPVDDLAIARRIAFALAKGMNIEAEQAPKRDLIGELQPLEAEAVEIPQADGWSTLAPQPRTLEQHQRTQAAEVIDAVQEVAAGREAWARYEADRKRDMTPHMAGELPHVKAAEMGTGRYSMRGDFPKVIKKKPR